MPPQRRKPPKKTRDLLEVARTYPGLNHTERLLLLASKGKVNGLTDTLSAEEAFAAYDDPDVVPADPYLQMRYRLHRFTLEHYPRISGFMVCPARVEGPYACLACPARLSIPCFLDNEDLLEIQIPMTTTAKNRLQMITALVAVGYPGPVLFKVADDVLAEATDMLDSGQLPDLKKEKLSDVQEQLHSIPHDDSAATTAAFKNAIASLSAQWVAQNGGEETAPKKAAPKTATKASTKASTKAAAKTAPKVAAKHDAEEEEEVTKPTTGSVDLSHVERTLGNLNETLGNIAASNQEMLERTAINDGTAAAMTAKVRQTARQVEIIGNGLNMLLQGVFGMELEGWDSTQGEAVDSASLEDLSDDELSELAQENYGAPSTVLGSRSACIAWITTTS